MTDIDFCLSSYMAYRYTFKDGVDYVEGMCHENFPPIPDDKKVAVRTAREIDEKIQRDFPIPLFRKRPKSLMQILRGQKSMLRNMDSNKCW